jgi:hypothetical protein
LLETLVGINIQDDKKPDWIRPLHQGGGGGKISAAAAAAGETASGGCPAAASSSEVMDQSVISSVISSVTSSLTVSHNNLSINKVLLEESPAVGSPEKEKENAVISGDRAGDAVGAPAPTPSANPVSRVRFSPHLEVEMAAGKPADGVVSSPWRPPARSHIDAWAAITGGGEDLPGKVKRPIRRGVGKPPLAKAVQFAETTANDDGTKTSVTAAVAPAPGAVQPSKSQISDKIRSKTMQKSIVERAPTAPAPLGSRGLAGVNPASTSAASAAAASVASARGGKFIGQGQNGGDSCGDIEGM